MTTTEFNNKWCDHLEEGHYGMDIPDADIIRYMDEQFTEEDKVNPSFSYSQIKIKWGWSRVYTTSDKASLWEEGINKILIYKNKINRFVERLQKIGIKVKLAGNYPWVYLREINGKNVTETFCAEHGFTIAFEPIKDGQELKFTDIGEIFKLIRKYR